MGLYKRKNSPFWWLQYFAHGEKVQESSRTRHKTEALQQLSRRKEEIRLGIWRHPSHRGVTFSQIVEAYYGSMAFEALRDETKRFYGQRIDILLEHFGITEVQGLTRRDMEAFTRKRQQEVSTTTVNHELTTLFTVLRWAEREGHISHLPFATGRLKPMRTDFRSRTLGPEEERLILAHSQSYQQAMIIAALDAGMHKKEIFGQQWADIDFERNIITMTASKKGREGRVVPLTNRFREVLEGLERESEYVFTYNGAPILTDIKKGWYRILQNAGVLPIRFHDLRATYGTRLEELDVPPTVSMALMGHKRKSAHDRYIRPTLPSLRKAIAKLDAWLKQNDLETTAFTNSEKAKVFRLNAG